MKEVIRGAMKPWHWITIAATVVVLFFVVRYFLIKRSAAIAGRNGTGSANPITTSSTVARPLTG